MTQWPPEGCKDKASCGKHAMCMYIECRHSSVNLEKENSMGKNGKEDEKI